MSFIPSKLMYDEGEGDYPKIKKSEPPKPDDENKDDKNTDETKKMVRQEIMPHSLLLHPSPLVP